MKIERIDYGFAILPSIGLNWIPWKDKTYYYVHFAWLFWCFNTLKKYPWD